MEGDEGADQMDQRGIVLDVLLPPYQDAPKAVHPATRALDRPAARPIAGNLLQQFPLGIAGDDVRHIAVLSHLAMNRVEVVAFIQPQPLFDVVRRQWTGCRNTIQRLLQQLEIHAVGARDGDAQDYPTAVHQQTALRALLAAVGRIRSGLFPRRAALSSAPRPSPDRPTESPAVRHSLADRAPRVAQTPLPASTPGNADGPHCWNRCRWRAARSTDSPCAARSRWHPWRGDYPRGGGDTPTDAACQAAAAARCVPTAHPACPSSAAPPPHASDSSPPSHPSPSLCSPPLWSMQPQLGSARTRRSHRRALPTQPRSLPRRRATRRRDRQAQRVLKQGSDRGRLV